MNIIDRSRRLRVAFVTSHPIQYQVPIFRILANHPALDFTVLFGQIPDPKTQGEGFGKEFQWDIPLLSGYRYEVLTNVSQEPSVTRFVGCDTPDIVPRIKTGDFDVIVVNGWGMKSSLQALWACQRYNVPCLVRGEANDIRPRAWWKRLIQRQLVHRYAACLYIGQASKAFYENRGVSPERLFPSLYCVDNDRFESATQRIGRMEARKQFGLRSDSTVFLFSGKLVPKKHPLELLESVAAISRRNTGLEVLIVGDGELRERCEQLVASRQLPVRFAGFLNQSQIVNAYVASNCIVLPSDHGETWGLVVNEAMACGCPAIVSDQVGCSADLISPGHTGNVFRFGAWNELSEMLEICSTQSSILRQWGDNAKLRIKSYSPSAAADGMYTAIRFACGIS